jgi:hypothetical protein
MPGGQASSCSESGVGVLKAAGISIRRRERHIVAVLTVTVTPVAIVLAAIAGFAVAFSSFFP